MSTVNQSSSDYAAMVSYWDMVSAIMGGTPTMRAGAEKYLPRFESESTDNYRERLEHSIFTNIFRSMIEDLASRPFTKEVTVKSSTAMALLMENVDGQYTHISKFLSQWFEDAIANGLSFVFVDYAKTDPNMVDASGRVRRKSVAEERQAGARPYAIMVPARDAIAVYSAMINGVEEFVHVRFREFFKRVEGFVEVVVEQVRVLTRDPILDESGMIAGFGHPRYELWESERGGPGTSTMKKVDEGEITLDKIPFTALVIGKRLSGWIVLPAMNDAAYLQIEHYEAQNGLKNLKKLTAFPMLTANGVDPDMDAKTGKPIPVPVGPRAVLYTGRPETGSPTGSWQIIEPTGSSLTFLREDVKDIAQELRELGRQPLTASSSNLTVVTTVFAARKGNAAIQNWALDLKDSGENFLMFMAMWSKDSQEPEIEMDLDFSLEPGENDGFSDVLSMRSSGDLSQDTLWLEAKRRGRLSSSFDPKKEKKAIEDETDELGDEADERDALDLGVGEGGPPTPEDVQPPQVPGRAPSGSEDDVS